MFRWNYCSGEHGDPYLLTFIGKKKNAGDETTLGINLVPKVNFEILGQKVELSTTGLSFSIKHKKQDNPLGSFLVNYCDYAMSDGLGTFYTTGSITARVREHH